MWRVPRWQPRQRLLLPGAVRARHRAPHAGAGHPPRARRPGGRGQQLGNLGNAYFAGSSERAIEHYTQALAISRELGDRRGEAAPGSPAAPTNWGSTSATEHPRRRWPPPELATMGEGNDLVPQHACCTWVSAPSSTTRRRWASAARSATQGRGQRPGQPAAPTKPGAVRARHRDPRRRWASAARSATSGARAPQQPRHRPPRWPQ